MFQLLSSVHVSYSYMLMGGAVDLWMLQVGRFLTGVAGGMTAASIPVGRHGDRRKYALNVVSPLCSCYHLCVAVTGLHLRDLPQVSERSSGLLPAGHRCVRDPGALRPE